MSEQAQTAQQAWDALEAFWSPFSFLLEPGATPEQIDTWQETEGVTLQPDVRALIGVHGSVGVPTTFYGDFCAETALSTIDQWTRFDRSILNKEQGDPDFWPQVFKDHKCPSTSMEDYVVVGSDPWGADYGIYLTLHQKSSAIFGITWNIPEIKALGTGTMTTWLGQRRLGGLKSVDEYAERWNKEHDDSGGAGLAKLHRFYLESGYGYPERLTRWEEVEAEFIKEFDALAAKSSSSG